MQLSKGGQTILDRVAKFLALISGVMLLGLMCLIVYSVFMRRVFNAPPLGVYDTAEVMLLPITAFALAYTGLMKGHIAVDIISAIAKPQIVRWSDAIVYFVCGGLIALLAWESALLVLRAIKVNEVTQMVEIPYYPFIVTLALGATIFALVLFRQSWRAITGKESPSEHE